MFTTWRWAKNTFAVTFIVSADNAYNCLEMGGLEASLPFEVYGHCEPGKMVCTVDLSQCRIHYESGTRRKDPDSLEIVPISMLDFCKALHKDISEHRDAWAKWNASYGLTGEGLQAQLDRLQKLIRSKEK